MVVTLRFRNWLFLAISYTFLRHCSNQNSVQPKKKNGVDADNLSRNSSHNCKSSTDCREGIDYNSFNDLV